MNKYMAKKTYVDGICFASKKEAARYVDLKRIESAGYISNLRLQVKFELAPSVVLNGRKRPPIRYIADFVYDKSGSQIVEDVKGILTPIYRLKKHLMKSVHGIDIVES